MVRYFFIFLSFTACFFFCVGNERVYAERSCSGDVCIETVENSGGVDFFVENNRDFPVTVKITVSGSNYKSTHGLPFIATISDQRKKVFTLSQQNGFAGWSYKWKYVWKTGDYQAEHEDAYLYRPPFAKSKFFKVNQSCHGKISHFGAGQYAIDFSMPLRTPVHAAREGIVIKTKADSNVGGPTKDFIDKANFVWIGHDDGTVATYAHLSYQGVRVKKGQRVERGQLIGLSGDTGYRRTPHLHFVVWRPTLDGPRESIRITWDDNAGGISCPPFGRTLLAK